MVARRLAASLIFALMLFGCQQNKPADKAMTPGTEDTVRAIRTSFQAVDPSAQVGLVIAVLPSDHLAAVSDIDVKQFSVGQALSFIDTNKNPIAVGKIVNILEDTIHVKYEVPSGDGSRAPREGDLAVRLK